MSKLWWALLEQRAVIHGVVYTNLIALHSDTRYLEITAKEMDYQLYAAVGFIPEDRTWQVLPTLPPLRFMEDLTNA